MPKFYAKIMPKLYRELKKVSHYETNCRLFLIFWGGVRLKYKNMSAFKVFAAGLFCCFCLVIGAGCQLNQSLLGLASEYANNAVFLDDLQKNLRKILSGCAYEQDCFEEESKDYIESKVCRRDTYESYGFISVKECDKACFSLADTISRTINQRAGSDRENPKAARALESLDEAEEDLDEARVDLAEAKAELYDAEDDLDRADDDDRESAREDYDEAYDEYRKAIKKEARVYASYRKALAEYNRSGR